MPFFVYLLQCADETYYCGWTTDMQKRIAAHNAGTASKYTCGRRPVQLVYFESVSDKSHALSREYELKQLSRSQKKGLIQSFGIQKKSIFPPKGSN